eukprot:GHVL01036980.1.p2 GENE.GHVL01036980.1~~GHVL01036980.1.p2  ORF type:complete len:199 (-),score=48.26 GHVL01036980.1:1900-2451(-)
MEQQSILDINDIYSRIDELYLASQELSERGLVVGAQRTIELADSFGVDTNNIKKNNTKKNNIKKNNIKLQRAQTYMMSREYARGAYVLQNIENIEEDFLCSFVWLYCIYMDGERRKEQDLMDTVDDEAKELATNPHLKQTFRISLWTCPLGSRTFIYCTKPIYIFSFKIPSQFYCLARFITIM